MRFSRNRFKRGIHWPLTLFLLWSGSVRAQVRDSSRSVDLTGSVRLESGQILKGKHLGVDFERQWLQRAFVNLGVTAQRGQRLAIHARAEGKLWYETFPAEFINDPLDVPERYFSFYPYRCEGVYSPGDPDRPFLRIGTGYFPFKYNKDVRNLGEYLFRSGTYPGWLRTEFDFPFAHLAGIRLSSRLFDRLDQHLLFTSETEVPPFFDFSLSYIAGYEFGRFLKTGAGVSFDRLVSVDRDKTSPENALTRYVEDDGDTMYYTFRGTKLMGMVSFDVKRLFRRDGDFAFWGEDDGKLYSEVAVLGAKNYPGQYDTLAQRIPWMIGFNVPAARLLDVLNIEVEWYGCKHPNFIPKINENPTYKSPKNDYLTYSYDGDDWKWSVYAKRTVVEGWSIIGQYANDHLRTSSSFEQTKDREEALTRPEHGYWMVKILYDF